MDPRPPRRSLTTDQKRALVILAIIGALIAIVSVGVAALATSMGLPLWVAVILAIVLAAGLGLFLLLNLA